MTEPVTADNGRHAFLPALSYPQYRLLWVSAFGTYTGRWMETMVGAWLVLELTDSPFMVGLLGTCRFTFMLLGPFCGTIADRFNRRLILLAVQVIYALASLIIMILFYTAQLEVWHLFVFTLIGGLCYTFDFSTRYATAADIVKSRHLASAMSLIIVAHGSTSILGPLLGGSLLEAIGASGSFALITASFSLSFLTLLPMKIRNPVKLSDYEPMWKNFISGLRYIKDHKVLFSLILIATLVNLFLFPFLFTLVPIFARDILHTSASGFAQLMASIGLGSVIGSLIAGSLPQFRTKGRLLIATVILWPVFLMIFSASHLFVLSMVLLVFAGMAQGMSMALIQILLLMHSLEKMRGRVTGARAFAISALPLGSLLTGYGIGLLGAPTILIINSLACILIALLIAIWAPELLKRE